MHTTILHVIHMLSTTANYIVNKNKYLIYIGSQIISIKSISSNRPSSKQVSRIDIHRLYINNNISFIDETHINNITADLLLRKRNLAFVNLLNRFLL